MNVLRSIQIDKKQKNVSHDSFITDADSNRVMQEALSWLLEHAPELFKNSRGNPMVDLSYKVVEWLPHAVGLTIHHTVYINKKYAGTAKPQNMIWLLAHELQHARLGFWGNIVAMLHPGAHDKLDADRAYPLMQKYIDEQNVEKNLT